MTMIEPEPPLPPLREVIKKYDLRAQKSLGQNFLLDLNLTGKIARSAGPLEGFTIIEIGPGPGGLTRGLLAEGAEKLIVIERDHRCLGALSDISTAYPQKIDVIAGDALEIDMSQLSDGPVKIVSNLPYNIATPLLIKWLSAEIWPPFFSSITVMVQKEVADRITAKPNTKAYGRLSIFCGWRTQAKKLFDVPASAFTPAPKVTSTLIQITPHPAIIEGIDVALLEKITASAFGQRRKMLRASLKSFTNDPRELLHKAGIEETKRAEQVDIEGFCRLAKIAKFSGL